MRTKTAAMAIVVAGWWAVSGGGCGPDLADEATAAVTATTVATVSAGGGDDACMGDPIVNGCCFGMAVDMTGNASVDIPFGGALGNVYDPPCFTVSPATDINFIGSFDGHPLRGGIDAVEDASLGIPAVDTGMMATFTPGDAGDYPYYCVFHQPIGMEGVIYVR